ncbi:hypothetical protein [Sphingobium fuliginis]|uniref:hypothetical protein n=1 Tax=Sphingobium fuliginis (strain ATCC 27551) TaxID=336203 RepID=UPI001FCC5B2C|nr:hypothetical protein [Sphingobium fuliginis]
MGMIARIDNPWRGNVAGPGIVRIVPGTKHALAQNLNSIFERRMMEETRRPVLAMWIGWAGKLSLPAIYVGVDIIEA